MHTTASKNSAANGSDRASAWIGNTPSSTPASRTRWRFSEALNHRSVAQTWTPNSRRRKIDDIARPHPRSSTRMPDRRSRDSASHSVSHSALAPPLTLATTHSGGYADERGNLRDDSASNMSLASSWLTGRSTSGETRRGESFRTRRLVGKPILPGSHLDDHGLAFLKRPPDPAGGVERPAAFGDLGQGCVGQADRRVRVGRDGGVEAEFPVYEFPRRGGHAVHRLERGASIREAAARLRLDADVLVAGLFRVGLAAGPAAGEPPRR